MNHRWRSLMPAVIAAALLLALAVGCGNVPKPDDELLNDDLPALPAAVVHHRVGVMPLVVDDAFTTYLTNTNESGTEPRVVYAPDQQMCRDIAANVAQALAEHGSYDEITFRPGAEGRKMDDILRDAWDDGLDLVVRPVLRKRDCYHTKTNDWYVPCLLMWFLVMPPSTWWIADEEFGSEMEMTLEFWNTIGDRAEPVATVTVRGEVDYQMDDFGQGFNLFNIFKTPSGLSEGQWSDIGKKLLPLSTQAAQRDWITQSATSEGGIASTLAAQDEKLQKMLAILCGAAPTGDRVPRFAPEDVQNIRRALQPRGSTGMVAPRALRTLDGARATREDLLEAIRDLGSHARDRDRMMLFLALRGIVDAKGKPWLLLADSRSSDLPGTALAIDDVAAELGQLPGTIAVVAAVTWSQPKDTDPINPWKALTGAGVLVFSATSPGEAVFEFEALPGSIFVDELANVIRRADEVDQDDDGWLSWTEIAAAMQGPINILSSQAGVPQQPVLLGDKELADKPFFHYAGASDEEGDGLDSDDAPAGDGEGDGPPDESTGR